MEKRYQVFVSSTYEDLQKERQAVIQSLLEFDCIPVGMEFFPAADDSAWEIIKRVIEESDYYVVIVAGRYGSLTPEGISYTQREYTYAVDEGVPVMAFLHGDPGAIPVDKSEKTDESRKKLNEFRLLCQNDKLCKFWKTPDELAGAVIKSLNQLKKTHPRVGWVRADRVPDEAASNTILRMRTRIEELEAERQKLSYEPPAGTESLAQGDDVFKVLYDVEMKVVYGTGSYDYDRKVHVLGIKATWNSVFNLVAPLMIGEASQKSIRQKMPELVTPKEWKAWIRHVKNAKSIFGFKVHEESFHTMIVQFRSLGLIVQSMRPRSVLDKETYWKLTPYGDNVLTKMRAIKRPS